MDTRSQSGSDSETLADTQTYSVGSEEDVEYDSLKNGENFRDQNAMSKEQFYMAQSQSVNEDSNVSYVGNVVDEQHYSAQSVQQDNINYQVDEQLYSVQSVDQDINVNYLVDEQIYSVQTVEQDINVNYQVNYSSEQYVEADGRGNPTYGGNAYSSQSAVDGQRNLGPGTVYPSQSGGMDGQGNPNYEGSNYTSSSEQYVEADGRGNPTYGGNAYSSQSAVDGQRNYGPGTAYPSQSAGMDGQGNPNYEGSDYIYSSQSAAVVDEQGSFGVYGGDYVDGMEAGREQRQEPAQANAVNGQIYRENVNNMGYGPGSGQGPQNPAQSTAMNGKRRPPAQQNYGPGSMNPGRGKLQNPNAPDRAPSTQQNYGPGSMNPGRGQRQNPNAPDRAPSAQQNYGPGSMNPGRGQRQNPNAPDRAPSAQQNYGPGSMNPGRGQPQNPNAPRRAPSAQQNHDRVVNNDGSVGNGQWQNLQSRSSVHWQQDKFNNGRGNYVNDGNGGRGPSRQHEDGEILNTGIGEQSYQSVHSSYSDGVDFNNNQQSHPNYETNHDGHGGTEELEQRYPAQHVDGHDVEIMNKPKRRHQAQHVNRSPNFNGHDVIKKSKKRNPAQSATGQEGKLLSKIDLSSVKRQFHVLMPLKAAKQKEMFFLLKNNIVDFFYVNRAEYANRICCYDNKHLLKQEENKIAHGKSSSKSMGKNIGRAVITVGFSLIPLPYHARRIHKANLKLQIIQAEVKRRGLEPREIPDSMSQALLVPACKGVVRLLSNLCCLGCCLGDIITSDAATDLITNAHSMMAGCSADLVANIGLPDEEAADDETLHDEESAEEETLYVGDAGPQQQPNSTFDDVLNTVQTAQSVFETVQDLQDIQDLQPNRQQQSASSESSSEDERNAPAKASKHDRRHNSKHSSEDSHKPSHKHDHQRTDEHGHKHNQRNSYRHNYQQENVQPQGVWTGADRIVRSRPAAVRDARNREPQASLPHVSVPNSGAQYYGPPPTSTSGMPSRSAPQRKNTSNSMGGENRAAPMQNSMGGRLPMQNEASSYNSVGRQVESIPTGLSHSRSHPLPPSHPQADHITQSRSVPSKGQLSHIREDSASQYGQASGVPSSQSSRLTANQAPRVESSAGGVQVRPRNAPPAIAQTSNVPVRPRTAPPGSTQPSSFPSVSANTPAPSSHVPIAPLCAELSSVPSFEIPVATVFAEPPNISSKHPNVVTSHVTTPPEESSTGQAFTRNQPPSQPPMATVPLPNSRMTTFQVPDENPNAQSQKPGILSPQPFRQPAAEPPIVPSTHRRSVPSEPPSASQPNSLPPQASSEVSELPKVQSSLPASSASRPSAPRVYAPRMQDGHGPLPSSSIPVEPSNVISNFPSVPSHPPAGRSFPPSAASRQANAPAYTPRARRPSPSAAE